MKSNWGWRGGIEGEVGSSLLLGFQPFMAAERPANYSGYSMCGRRSAGDGESIIGQENSLPRLERARGMWAE